MTQAPREDGRPVAAVEPGKSTSTRRIAQAFSQQLVFRLLGMVANVVTLTVTTRYLGVDSYGALTTAVVFVALWTSLTELGIGSVIVRKVMSGNGSLERLVRVNAGMSVIFSMPLFAVAAATGFFIYSRDDAVVEMIFIISISLILTSVSSCFQPVFMATLRFTAVAVSDFLSRLTTLAFTLLLIEVSAVLTWFAVVQIVPAVVVLVIQAVAAARIVTWWPIFIVKESWLLLRESLPQTAVLIIGVLYWRLDGVILSLRSSQDEVGIYGLAYTLAFTISVLPGFFGTSTLSAMTHLHAVDKPRFVAFVRGSVESMLFLGAPIAILGSLLSYDIILVLSSVEFVAKGAPTLGLLLIAATVGFITGVLSQALFSAHDQAFLLKLNIITLALNVVMNVTLAPRYGAIGAGIAMLATEVLGLLVASWRLGRLSSYRTPWGFGARLSIPVTACVIFALAAHHSSIFVVIPSAAAIYVAVNLVVGPVTWRRLWRLVQRSSDGPTVPPTDDGRPGDG